MAWRVIFPLVLFYLLQISDISLAWRPFKLIFTKFELECNEKWAHIEGDIIKNSSGSTYIVGNFTIKKDIIDDVMVNIGLEHVHKHLGKPVYINITVNMCEILKKPITQFPPVIRGIYKLLISHVDLPLRCPIKKNMYNLTAVGDIEEEFPPYIPTNVYSISLIYSNKRTKEFFARTTLFVKAIINRENRNKRPK